MSDGEEEPARRLKNLQAMLKWAAEHGSHGTAPEDAITAEDDPEFEAKRLFLLEAVKSLTVDIVQKMLDAIKVLAEVDDATADAANQKEEAMDELLDLIEDLDNADDFRKMGGFDLCLGALSSAHPGVQWRAAECLATAVQNHLPLQQKLQQAGGLEVLLTALGKPATEPMVRTKVVRALSCLVSGNEAAVAAFVAADGFVAVARVMGEVNEAASSGGAGTSSKLATKLLFLVAALVQRRRSVAAAAARAGVAAELVRTLPAGPSFADGDGDTDANAAALWEHGLRATVAVAAAAPEGHAAVREQAATGGLLTLLAARAAFVASRSAADRPAYEEEEAFAATLGRLLKAKVWPGDSGGGRSPSGAGAGTEPMLALPAPGGGSVAAVVLDDADGATWHPSIASESSSKPPEDFDATTEWQPVYDHHVLPAGCDIKVDLQSGKKFARVSAQKK